MYLIRPLTEYPPSASNSQNCRLLVVISQQYKSMSYKKIFHLGNKMILNLLTPLLDCENKVLFEASKSFILIYRNLFTTLSPFLTSIKIY